MDFDDPVVIVAQLPLPNVNVSISMCKKSKNRLAISAIHPCLCQSFSVLLDATPFAFLSTFRFLISWMTTMA